MDFSGFEGVSHSNTRRGNPGIAKEQNFEFLKYRKAVKEKDGVTKEDGKFTIATARFKDWNIDNGYGFKQFTNPTTGETVLAVVAEADAVIMRKTKKGEKTKSFKSTRLEAAFAALKLIDTSKANEGQYISLDVVAENVTIKGTACVKVLKPSVGSPKAKVEEVTKSMITPTPNAQSVAAPATEGADWD